MTKVVAIHQPNFFPWLGYFDKVVRSDAFIFLDDVQFPKTGGIWSNRVKILIGGQAKWVTAPITRNFTGTRKINEMEFSTGNWREKFLKTISQSYCKTPYYKDCISVVESLLCNPEQNIAEYNMHAVRQLSGFLGIDGEKFTCSSMLPHTGSANELLISLTGIVGGDVYLCGGGADGYQDDSVFEQLGMDLQYQNFSHPVYPQPGNEVFVPGLSIIDAAMNLGWQGVKDLLSTPRC